MIRYIHNHFVDEWNQVIITQLVHFPSIIRNCIEWIITLMLKILPIFLWQIYINIFLACCSLVWHSFSIISLLIQEYKTLTWIHTWKSITVLRVSLIIPEVRYVLKSQLPHESVVIMLRLHNLCKNPQLHIGHQECGL